MLINSLTGQQPDLFKMIVQTSRAVGRGERTNDTEFDVHQLP